MTDREIMQQALEALEGIQRFGLDTLSGRVDGPDDREWQRAGVNEMTKRARLGITAIKEALAQPEQEPVASYCRECLTYNGHQEGCSHYINNPIRNQLTNEQILAANYPDGEENGPTIAAPDFELICFARAIETAHGIKGEP